MRAARTPPRRACTRLQQACECLITDLRAEPHGCGPPGARGVGHRRCLPASAAQAASGASQGAAGPLREASRLPRGAADGGASAGDSQRRRPGRVRLEACAELRAGGRAGRPRQGQGQRLGVGARRRQGCLKPARAQRRRAGQQHGVAEAVKCAHHEARLARAARWRHGRDSRAHQTPFDRCATSSRGAGVCHRPAARLLARGNGRGRERDGGRGGAHSGRRDRRREGAAGDVAPAMLHGHDVHTRGGRAEGGAVLARAQVLHQPCAHVG